MRLIPWRGTQPTDSASAADQAKLHERLARLTGGPAPTEAPAPILSDAAEAKPAVQDAVPTPPAATAEPIAESVAESVAEPVAESVGEPVAEPVAEPITAASEPVAA